MNLVAIIPARSGSKGLPGKNMRLLAGKPLAQHAIDAARDCGLFSRILVSSDDSALLALAQRLDAITLPRPLALASDTATMSDVVADVHRTCSERGLALGDAFALLQPTSPMRTARHIAECVNRFSAGRYASAVSVCADAHPPQKSMAIVDGRAEPLFGWEPLQANRQTLPATYRQNGAIWIVTWQAFLAHGRFVVAPAMPYVMDEADSLDIDTLADFKAAEAAFAERIHA